VALGESSRFVYSGQERKAASGKKKEQGDKHYRLEEIAMRVPGEPWIEELEKIKKGENCELRERIKKKRDRGETRQDPTSVEGLRFRRHVAHDLRRWRTGKHLRRGGSDTGGEKPKSENSWFAFWRGTERVET